MARSLLLRGMLVGLVAGLFVFAFARWAGEPQVDKAIAFETSMDQAKGEPPEPEMVSRKIQKGFGLLTGVVMYGTALGGIFGLVFAYARVVSATPGLEFSLLCWQGLDSSPLF